MEKEKGGDFNARTGKERGGSDKKGEREVRKSLDQDNERNELIEENGLAIRNGNIDGYREGDLTYNGTRCSVII